MATWSVVMVTVLGLCTAVLGQSIEQCSNYECPDFTVLSSTPEYELRQYAPSKWVETSYTTNTGFFSMYSNWRAKGNAFRRLFAFIQGANSAETKMDMTVPVLMKVVPNADGSKTNTMYFMVPSAHRASTPTPTATDVALISMPQLDVYVRTYGGFSSQSKEEKQLTQLKDAVGDPNLYENSYYYVAGYDSPWTIMGRRNEVWAVKK